MRQKPVNSCVNEIFKSRLQIGSPSNHFYEVMYCLFVAQSLKRGQRIASRNIRKVKPLFQIRKNNFSSKTAELILIFFGKLNLGPGQVLG